MILNLKQLNEHIEYEHFKMESLQGVLNNSCNVKHVHISTDNSSALAYINNMGGMHSVICNDIAKRIWQFALNRGFRISSRPIPGAENIVADKISRVFSDNTE